MGSAGIAFRQADKSQLAVAVSLPLIVLHSPYASLKPDCACGLRRKAGTVTPFSAEQSVLCSPICCGIIAKNGHLSRIPGERAAEFLCSPDYVAEREGFEPSVQVLARTTV
jgi:hypothetical protein